MALKVIKGLFGLKDIDVTPAMTVKELQDQFREQFGVGIRVYKLNSSGEIFTGRGAKKAESGQQLKDVARGEPGSITLKKSMLVKEVEDIFARSMGIGVQVENKEGSLASNEARVGDLARM